MKMVRLGINMYSVLVVLC